MAASLFRRACFLYAFAWGAFSLPGGCMQKRIGSRPTGVVKDERPMRAPEGQGCARHFDRETLARWDAEVRRSDKRRIGVASLNDLHGHIEAHDVTIKGKGEGAGARMRVGGPAVIAQYFASLCAHYRGQVLILDAGDGYQGTLLSNLHHGKPVMEALSVLGVHATTFGNHEFDFGLDALDKTLRFPKRAFLYLSANLRDMKDGARLPWNTARIPRLAKSALFDFAGVKIGVLGMTTETTPGKTFEANTAGIDFKAPKDTVGDEARALRTAGAQAVVLLAHAGGACDMDALPNAGDKACADESDELVAFLKEGGARDVDAAVGGHAHHAQRHFVSGVPVVQTTGFGKSFGWMELEVKVGAKPDDAREDRLGAKVMQPVFFCHSAFDNYKSCNPMDAAWGAKVPGTFGKVVPASFLGKAIDPEAPSFKTYDAVLEDYLGSVVLKRAEKVTTLAKELSHDRDVESPMGLCYVDVMFAAVQGAGQDGKIGARSEARVDGVVMNSGGLRTGIPAGQVTYEHAFAMAPFDNAIALLELSKDELLGFLKLLGSNGQDLPYVSAGWAVDLAKEQGVWKSVGVRAPQATGMDGRVRIAISEFLIQYAEKLLGKEEAKKRVVFTPLDLRDGFVKAVQAMGPAKLPPSCLGTVSGRLTFQGG